MGELVKKLIGAAWAKIEKLPATVRFVAILMLVCLLVLGGRCGIGGDAVRNTLWEIVPYETPMDCPRATLTTSIRLHVLQGGEYGPVRYNNSYKPGTQMKLTASASQPCWLAILAFDANGSYQIHPRSGDDPARYDPTSALPAIPFQLNNTKGVEVYLVVASLNRFNLAEIIKKGKKQIDDLGRGPDLFRVFDFPDYINSDAIIFKNSGWINYYF